jgi:hypothetical protein
MRKLCVVLAVLCLAPAAYAWPGGEPPPVVPPVVVPPKPPKPEVHVDKPGTPPPYTQQNNVLYCDDQGDASMLHYLRPLVADEHDPFIFNADHTLVAGNISPAAVPVELLNAAELERVGTLTANGKYALVCHPSALAASVSPTGALTDDSEDVLPAEEPFIGTAGHYPIYG